MPEPVPMIDKFRDQMQQLVDSGSLEYVISDIVLGLPGTLSVNCNETLYTVLGELVEEVKRSPEFEQQFWTNNNPIDFIQSSLLNMFGVSPSENL